MLTDKGAASAALNRLIARTMRQLQLATGENVKRNLRWALGWLNRARASLKAGLADSYRLRLECAHRCIKSARMWQAFEA